MKRLMAFVLMVGLLVSSLPTSIFIETTHAAEIVLPNNVEDLIWTKEDFALEVNAPMVLVNETVRGSKIVGFSSEGRAKYDAARAKYGNVPIKFPRYETAEENPIKIENDAFKGIQFSSIDLSNLNGIIEIGTSAFAQSYASEILGLDSMSNLRKISNRAFYETRISKGEDGELSFRYNQELEYIGDYAFYSGGNLGLLEIKDLPKLSYIGFYAFESTGGKTTILENLPLLREIKTQSFRYGNREVVRIANNALLEKIGESSFYNYGSSKTKTIQIENNPVLKVIDGYAFNGHNASVIDLNTNPMLERIGYSAFSREYRNTDLKVERTLNIDQLSNLKRIENYAFSGYNQLTGKIFSPHNEKLEYLGQGVFNNTGYVALADLSNLSALSQIDTGIFDEAPIVAVDLRNTPNLRNLPQFSNSKFVQDLYFTKGQRYNSIDTNFVLSKGIPNGKWKWIDAPGEASGQSVVMTTSEIKAFLESEQVQNFSGTDIHLVAFDDSREVIIDPSNDPYLRITTELKDNRDVILTPYGGNPEKRYREGDLLILPQAYFDLIVPETEKTIGEYLKENYNNGEGYYDYESGGYIYSNTKIRTVDGINYLIVDKKGQVVLPFFARPFGMDFTGDSQMKRKNSPVSLESHSVTIPERTAGTDKPKFVQHEQNEETGTDTVTIVREKDESTYLPGSTVTLRYQEGSGGLGTTTREYTIKEDGTFDVPNEELTTQYETAYIAVKEPGKEYSDETSGHLAQRMVITDTPKIVKFQALPTGDGEVEVVVTNQSDYQYPYGTKLFAYIGKTEDTLEKVELEFDPYTRAVIPAQYVPSADSLEGLIVRFAAKEPRKFISEKSEPRPMIAIAKTIGQDLEVTRDGDEGKITPINPETNTIYPANTILNFYGAGDTNQAVGSALVSPNGEVLLPRGLMETLKDERYSYKRIKEGTKYTIKEPLKFTSELYNLTEPSRSASITVTLVEDDGTGLVVPKTPDGQNYPEGTTVVIKNLKGEDFTLTLDSKGQGLIPREKMPPELLNTTADITAPGKLVDENVSTEVPASNMTQVSAITVVLDNTDGSGIVTPKRHDGSYFPEGTLVLISNIGYDEPIYISNNGTGRIPPHNMPAQDTNTTSTVRAPGLSASEVLDTLVPKGWDTTVVPNIDSSKVSKDEYGNYIVHFVKPDGSQYPSGTVLNYNGTKISMRHDGTFAILDKYLTRKYLNDEMTLTEPQHFESEKFILSRFTQTPDTVKVYQKDDGVLLLPLKADGSTYDKGTMIYIEGMDPVIINTPAGSAFISGISDPETFVRDKHAFMEDSDKMKSLDKGALVYVPNEEAPRAINKAIDFYFATPLVEKVTENGSTSIRRLQISGSVLNIDLANTENAKVFIKKRGSNENVGEVTLDKNAFKFTTTDKALAEEFLKNGVDLVVEYDNTKTKRQEASVTSHFKVLEVEFDKATGNTVGGGGAPGPRGPAGIDGPQGPQGPQGPKGEGFSLLNKEDHLSYMIGYPEGDFRPNANMTRAEAAMMFSRLLAVRPTKNRIYKHSFTDIKDSNWFATAVSFMNEKNLISGYPDGTFRPNAKITRAEFASMAARFDAISTKGKLFNDVPESHWASDAISRAVSKEWILGYPDETFRPNQAITRAEVISITNRVLNRYADEDFIQIRANELKQFTDVGKTDWYYPLISEAVNSHSFEREKNGKDEKWTSLIEPTFVY